MSKRFAMKEIETGKVVNCTVPVGKEPFIPEGYEAINGEIPSIDDLDPEFSDCMVEINGEPSIDITKAKDKKKLEIRNTRNFTVLDQKFAEHWSKAVADPANAGKTIGEMAALTDIATTLTEQQELRDLPEAHDTAVDALSTIEEVKAYELA